MIGISYVIIDQDVPEWLIDFISVQEDGFRAGLCFEYSGCQPGSKRRGGVILPTKMLIICQGFPFEQCILQSEISAVPPGIAIDAGNNQVNII